MQIFSSFFASIKNLLDPIDENNTIQLPRDLQLHCLHLLTVKDLARFSLASRTCKILASTNSLWANFAVQLSLDPKIYHNQQSLQWGLLIHKTLQLPDRLGDGSNFK